MHFRDFLSSLDVTGIPLHEAAAADLEAPRQKILPITPTFRSRAGFLNTARFIQGGLLY